MIKIEEAIIKEKNFLLENINIHIKPNKIMAIIGKNASGKSSLLHLLTGAYPATRTLRKDLKIAFVDEHWPFKSNQSLYEIAQLTKQIEKDFDSDLFEEILLAFKIEPHDTYAQLSKGNQKMSVLAFALTRKPDVLILDEILLNMDEYRKQHFKDILLNFMSVPSRSIVISTNQIDGFEDIVDDLIYLKDKHITYQGTLLDLKKQYRILKVAHDEVDRINNVVSIMPSKYYTEVCIKEINAGSSDLLDILTHLEKGVL